MAFSVSVNAAQRAPGNNTAWALLNPDGSVTVTVEFYLGSWDGTVFIQRCAQPITASFTVDATTATPLIAGIKAAVIAAGGLASNDTVNL